MKKSIHNGTSWKNRTSSYRESALRSAREASINHDGASNRQYAETESFQEACQLANVKPTKRQASKYRRGLGSAFNTK